ncbi:MAG: amidohydrolase family protein, partial [Nitrospiraceae bacterium]|nr:amidohydrolase family protein [Nitrospiraceae bacterium]
PDDPLTERSMFAPLKDPGVAVSTDTILMGNGKPSHLFHGCYPKFIGRFVRDMSLLSLETAVRKITGLPAEHFQLNKRGRIAKGYHADLLVFDFDRIAARGSFLEPDKEPEGIEHVFINGAHVVNQGTFRPEPRPGGVLRGGG